MSKNMTRKGLAFGAGLSLVASGFAALPATAAAAPSMAPTAGTLYGALSSEDFGIRIALPTDTPVATFGNNLFVTVESLDGNLNDAGTNDLFTLTTNTDPSGATAASADADELEDAEDVVSLNIADNVATDADRLFNLTLADIDAVADITFATGKTSASFKITSWVDVDGLLAAGAATDAPTGNEVAATATLTVYDTSELSYTLTVDEQNPVTDSTGEVTIAEPINLVQLGADLDGTLSVGFAKVASGTYTSGAAAVTTVSAAGAFTAGATVVVYDPATGALDVTIDESVQFADEDTANGDVLAFQLIFGGAEVGNEVRKTVFTSAITDIDVQMTSSSTVGRTGGTVEEPTAWTVLTGSKSATMNVEVFNTGVSGSGDEEAQAGASVAVSVTATDLDADSIITVNGTSIEDGDDPITVTGTTNSSGVVRLTISSNSGEEGDTITLAVTSPGSAQTSTVTLTWSDSEEGALVWWDAVGDNAVYAVATEAKFNLTYAGKDTFGAPLGSDFRVAVTYNGTTYYSQPFAGGAASVEIEDDNTASTTEQVTAVVEQKSSTTGNFAATAVQVQHNVSVIKTPKVAATVDASVTDDEDVALETRKLTAGDTRLNSFAGPKLASGAVGYASAGTLLSGTVTDANGAGVAGAVVTITAAGLAFEADGNYTLDSITVRADGAGFFSGVTVRSATGGTKTLTVTSGAKSDTVTIAFDGSATISEDAKLTISAPATAAAGSVVNVEVTLIDENGNPLAGDTVSFSNTGPGYLNSATAVTGANGKASVKLLVGAGESGTAAVTALVDYAVGKFITATTSITIGAPAGGKVNVGSFNGKLVVYAAGLSGSTISWKVGGTWGKEVASSNYSVFNRPTPRAGVTVSVQIYVDGVLTLTKSVVTR